MRYKTILLDPPWPVSAIKMKRRPNSVTLPYQTMTIQEITDLNIGSIADDDCNLFMWTTHKFLPDALNIVKAWGFKYHVTLTWIKENGYSVSGFTRNTEFVIYAYRGKMQVNQRGHYIPTSFYAKRQAHSKKPDILYELIESNANRPYAELFARNKRDGWDIWGNELENDIELQGTI